MSTLKLGELTHFKRLKRISDEKWCIEKVKQIFNENEQDEINEKKVNKGIKRKKLLCEEMNVMKKEYCKTNRSNLFKEIDNCKNINEESIFLKKISNLSDVS